MNSIAIFKRDCIYYASMLGDYQSMTVNELADGYCKALDDDDEANKNKYLSALVLRFWYTIKKMYDKTITANFGAYEDYVAKLYECINIACAKENRAWQDPNKKTTAQACINQAIASRGVAEIMYNSNLDKHKANVLTVSLDAPMHNNDDYDTLGESFEDEDESVENVRSKLSAELLVQSYINKNKIIEAIILDTIAFNDCEKEVKKVVKVKDEDGNDYKRTDRTYSFWEYKAVQALSQLPSNYYTYFVNKYEVKSEILESAINAIRNSTNQKLYRQLRATLNYARNNYIARN